MKYLFLLFFPITVLAGPRPVTFIKVEGEWRKAIQPLGAPNKYNQMLFNHECQFNDFEAQQKSAGLKDYKIMLTSNPGPRFYFMENNEIIPPLMINDGEMFSVTIECVQETRGWGCW